MTKAVLFDLDDTLIQKLGVLKNKTREVVYVSDHLNDFHATHGAG